MKARLFMTLIVAILHLTTAIAQESDNMEFMGIPITGNVNDFSSKLKSKGFSPQPDNDGYITLAGKFTNRDVAVILFTTEKTNNIYRVGVVYEPNTNWDSLESHQNYLVDAFTKKYGKPSNSIREIDSPYDDSGNMIFLGFYTGKVNYADSWDLKNGYILISITAVSSNSASITIIYEDKASSQALEESIMNDI